MRYGQQYQPQNLGLLGYIGLCSDTLEDALINFSEAFKFHQHRTLASLIDLCECYRFDYQVRHAAITERRHDTKLSLCTAINLVRHVLGAECPPREVAFEHPKPETWQEHREVFKADVVFGMNCNYLLIPKRDLVNKVMPGSDPVLLLLLLLLLLLKEAIRKLGESMHEKDLDSLDQVKHTIGAELKLGEPDLKRISNQLDRPEWTLQRKLRECGLTFTQLADQIRRELALAHFRKQNISMSELSSLLGYSESSTFSRAFKRWFGVSPMQWRSAKIK